MEFKKGLIDKQLQGQLSTVFTTFDKDKKDALNYEQFCTYLYAIGMNFIVKEYEQMLIKQLFGGDKNSKRVRFDQFFGFLEDNSIHEISPEQFEKELMLFDEDRNGVAVVDDILRVLTTYNKDMSNEDIEFFVKVCALQPNLTEAQQKTKLKDLLKDKTGFQIKDAIAHLFNI